MHPSLYIGDIGGVVNARIYSGLYIIVDSSLSYITFITAHSINRIRNYSICYNYILFCNIHIHHTYMRAYICICVLDLYETIAVTMGNLLQ